MLQFAQRLQLLQSNVFADMNEVKARVRAAVREVRKLVA